MDENDDLMSYFNNWTTTDTQDDSPSYQTDVEETEVPESYQAYRDDYNSAPSFTEETNYDSVRQTDDKDDISEMPTYSSVHMFAPTIQKTEEGVTLTKTKVKLRLTPRMKLMISMFSVIIVALLFATIYNFASLSSINSTISMRATQVESLNQSIQELTETYILISSDEQLYDRAQESGFVERDETNTKVIEIGEIYTEDEIPTVQTNWFDKVCEFLSNLFS